MLTLIKNLFFTLLRLLKLIKPKVVWLDSETHYRWIKGQERLFTDRFSAANFTCPCKVKVCKMQKISKELVEKLEDVQKSQAKLGVVLKAICEQIGVISNEPAREAKAETNAISKSDVVERKFENPSADEDGSQGNKLFKSLSDNPLIAKSQISEALCDLVKKGEAADTDVIGFESGGYIRPELVGKLKEKLN